MSFSSIHFIFVFFPITLLLFYILPFKNWRNAVMIFASLFFFGWADPTHLPLLLFSILINYVLGLIVGLFVEKEERTSAKHFMWIAVGVNLLILVFYKYYGFLLDSFLALARITLTYKAPAFPLGISFFTFSGISYILDVYNEAEKAERNILRFSSYLIMFLKLLQGPITRFSQVKQQLINPRFKLDDMMQGTRRFIAGLAKKVLIADALAAASQAVLNANFESVGAGVAWFGLIAFTLQIYFDFSGYSDMAIGLGKIFGFSLPENFNYPYISRSITDFWRRWHMTLTNWFRTYLFIPLEFARKKVPFLRQQTDILIVFILTGLWHGASWNFVIWGAYFGLILAIEASGWSKRLKKLPGFIQHGYSLILIITGWIFFSITDIQKWGAFFTAILGGHGWTSNITLRTLNILFYIPIAIIAIFLCLPYLHQVEEKVQQKGGIVQAAWDLLYIGLFILCIAYILSNGFTAFMYAQF